MDDDLRYLNLVSIFHYVVAGIAGLFACFPIFHLAIGLSFLGEIPNMADQGDVPFPFMLFPILFTVIPAVLILFGWLFAIAVALTGYFIQQRRMHTFCLVMGAVETMFMPFGTVLGVFTLILLTKADIKKLFVSAQHPL
jgi:hypothetical protein